MLRVIAAMLQKLTNPYVSLAAYLISLFLETFSKRQSLFSMWEVDKLGALSLGFRRFFRPFHRSFEFAAGRVAMCPFTDPCPLPAGSL